MHDMNTRIDRAIILYFCAPWNMEICRRQWRFAQYVSQLRSSSPVKAIVAWNPRELYDHAHPYYAYRRPGHPRAKWDQGLQNFFQK